MQISTSALQNFHANCALITTESSPWVLPLWPQSNLAFLSGAVTLPQFFCGYRRPHLKNASERPREIERMPLVALIQKKVTGTARSRDHPMPTAAAEPQVYTKNKIMRVTRSADEYIMQCI